MCLRVVPGMAKLIATSLAISITTRALVVALDTVNQSLSGFRASRMSGKPRKSSMNYGELCDPIPAADVDGFRFYRDQNGDVVARCVRCRVGFTVRNETAEAVRPRMVMHLESAHGWR